MEGIKVLVCDNKLKREVSEMKRIANKIINKGTCVFNMKIEYMAKIEKKLSWGYFTSTFSNDRYIYKR